MGVKEGAVEKGVRDSIAMNRNESVSCFIFIRIAEGLRDTNVIHV